MSYQRDRQSRRWIIGCCASPDSAPPKAIPAIELHRRLGKSQLMGPHASQKSRLAVTEWLRGIIMRSSAATVAPTSGQPRPRRPYEETRQATQSTAVVLRRAAKEEREREISPPPQKKEGMGDSAVHQEPNILGRHAKRPVTRMDCQENVIRPGCTAR